ncbi:L-cystine transport system permease protein YecS [Caprobacter fermentans]|uniref:Amino acid ABC transporter permease n=1 Tax=Caproicibacter fermentans TaxID=2576756 RepID=A0A6N8HVU7_9FIRM|nr:amino acid ABC transporter permease [Caproicibacter fermentans]MVB09842.1 L-cystine transport system permease protein YecS [Caproicibacter fermentans]QNK42281.1 amino acid ABC transporter permease [Caproicibacter fermentans]
MNYTVLLSQMLQATLMSLRIFFSTLLFSVPLGLLVAAGRRSKVKAVNLPVRFYILLMRGTPLMLQLLFIFYGLKPLTGIQLDRVAAAQVAFLLNYAAYFAEIFRGGIDAVPAGQYEAARVLGFTKRQTFFRIVLPQVCKMILPPMSNEFINLVKDTSLAQVIGVTELLRVTSDWVSSAVSMAPFAIAAVFYLLMNAVVTRCFTVAEARMNYYR